MSDEFPTPNVPRYKDPQFVKDALERVLWTTLYGVVSAVSVDQFELPLWSIPIVLAGLNTIKVFVAKQIGNPGSASTVPTI